MSCWITWQCKLILIRKVLNYLRTCFCGLWGVCPKIASYSCLSWKYAFWILGTNCFPLNSYIIFLVNVKLLMIMIHIVINVGIKILHLIISRENTHFLVVILIWISSFNIHIKALCRYRYCLIWNRVRQGKSISRSCLFPIVLNAHILRLLINILFLIQMSSSFR